jgi:hypothetical protein
MILVNKTYAAGAIPMGSPGWPLLAFWTASMESVRMVSMDSCSIDVAEVAASMGGHATHKRTA